MFLLYQPKERLFGYSHQGIILKEFLKDYRLFKRYIRFPGIRNEINATGKVHRALHILVDRERLQLKAKKKTKLQEEAVLKGFQK